MTFVEAARQYRLQDADHLWSSIFGTRRKTAGCNCLVSYTVRLILLLDHDNELMIEIFF